MNSLHIENSNDKKYIELKNILYEVMNNTNLEFNDNSTKSNNKEITFNPTKKVRLDIDKLNEIINTFGNLFTGRDGGIYNDNRYTYKRNLSDLWKLIKKLNEIENEHNGYYIPSGFYYYPPNGACGWHTNSNNPGKRIYLTYTKEENKSFFRYYDNLKKEIVTKYDKKGWCKNKFTVKQEEYFWHCIGSDTNRISIGFNLVERPCLIENLVNIYESHFNDMSNNIIYKKSNNMFRNFLVGKYYTSYTDLKSKNYVLDLIKIQNIFIRDQLQSNIQLSDIYWNNKEKCEIGKFHPDIDILFPVILLKSNDNPLNLEYITIDGNERLSKIASLNIKIISAFVIDKTLFYKNIRPTTNVDRIM